MQIFGIIGPIGHGKSSAAAHLHRKHGFEIVNFSDALKETCAQVYAPLGVAATAFFGTQEEKAEPIPELGGVTGRRILELVGTDGFRAAYDATWLDIGMARAAKHERVVIGDLRFPNEAARVRQRCGKIIRVFAAGKEVPASKHESDDHWRTMVADHEIRVPFGELDRLYDALDSLLVAC